MTVPRLPSRSRNVSGALMISSSASSQPSTASGRKRLAPRRASRRTPGPRTRTSRAARAMLGKLAPGQEAQHLELGVDPGLELAEHLQHDRVVEHERRVRLLDAHHADAVAVGQARAIRRTGWKLKRPVGGLDLVVGRRSGAAARAPARARPARRRRPSRRCARDPRDRPEPRPARRSPAAAGRARACRWRSGSGRARAASSGSLAQRDALDDVDAGDGRDLEAYQRCCWTQSRSSSSARHRRISSAADPLRPLTHR